MRFRVEPSFDLPDHKCWECWIGKHCEGDITYLGPSHELVVKECHSVGYFLDVIGNDLVVYDDGPFVTFEAALAAFEKALMGREQQ